MNDCKLCSNIGRYEWSMGYYVCVLDPDSIIIYDDKRNEYDIWSNYSDSLHSRVLISDILCCPKCGRKLKEINNE